MQDIVSIYHARKPLWQLCIGAVFFTATAVVTYYGIMSNRDILFMLPWLVLASLFLMIGMLISKVSSFHFDLERNRFREDYHFGPVKLGSWEPLPNLEYVSVFKKNENYYQINLWIEGNDFYMLGAVSNREEAIDSGRSLAKQLQIDLLDAATDPGNSVWVDLD